MLKPYIDMNTEYRTEAKSELENIRNHRDIKLVTSDKRRKRLVSEPNYHSHKIFSECLMAIEIKKTRVKMIIPYILVCQY